MIKLLSKFILLLAIVILLSELGCTNFGLPYYWGNAQLRQKQQYLQSTKIDPSIYFIGSSVTYHCAIPRLFDELTNQPTNTSFNLATDGTYLPQTLYIVDHLLKQDTTVDYIFFEFNNINHLPEHLYRTTRSKYYYQLEHLLMSCKYLFYSHYTDAAGLRSTHKLGIVYKYVNTFFEGLLKIGMRKDMLTAIALVNKQKIVASAKGTNGYGRLNDYRYKKESYVEQLSIKMERTKKEYEKAHRSLKQTSPNTALVAMLSQEIEQASEKGTKIIYVLTPIEYGFETIPNMLASFYSLPATNRIDLSSPSKYPELFLPENRWDDGHFNHKGAEIYTQYLKTHWEFFLE